MSLPYFPLYPTDFEAKTSHLTMAEDGAYNRLLRICWMTPGCTIPTDEAWIMRRVRAHTDAEKDVVRAVLAEFFAVTNGRYSNARLMRVWLASNDAHEKRKNAGAKGGKAKSLKTNTKQPSNALAMAKQPEPEPEPDIKREAKASPKKQNDFDLFWAEVPRKVSKGTAEKAFAKAIKLARPEVIIAGMRRYAESREGEDHQYTAHPATWLNGQRWLDEAAPKDDFHDQVTRMLKGEVNGLQRENAGVDGSPKRLSAPVQETGPSGQRDAAGGDEGDGGGDQLPHIRLIRPKRF